MVCLLLVAQRCSGPWAKHTAEDIQCSRWLLMPHYRKALKLHNVTSREFSVSAAECTIIVLTAKNWAANISLCWLSCCITWVYFLSVGVYEYSMSVKLSLLPYVHPSPHMQKENWLHWLYSRWTKPGWRPACAGILKRGNNGPFD